MENELYVDSIQFSYNDRFQLLTGVYLSCKVGEVIGLLGRNGTGKSTLMKIIFGSLKPKYAFIRINGKSTKQAFTTQEVVYLPQASYLPTSERVKTVVKVMFSDKAKRSLILNDKRIHMLKDQKVYELSGGERRYLEILLLIHQKATFLLLDEPFSEIEPFYVEAIQELIRSHQSDKGFIISDHDYQNVLDVSTRITLLKDGGCMEIKDKRELELFYVPEGTFST